jgi:hypothetical protein
MIQAARAAGTVVNVVGPTGLPAEGSSWRENDCVLRQDPAADGACTFECLGPAMLDLGRDPGTDRYLLAFEIRHMAGRAHIGQVDPVGAETVGVYFGADAHMTPDGRKVTPQFRVQFNDFRPPGGSVIQSVVSARDVLSYDGSESLDPIFTTGSHPFDPVERRPGKWRKIVIDIAPDSIDIFWRDAEGSLARVHSLDGIGLARRHHRFQEAANESSMGRGLALRPWQPRLPFGIWCYQSRVAFRNVQIIPVKAVPKS